MIATAPGTHELVRALGADLVLESVGPLARREYDAHGLPFHDAAHAVGSLAKACTVIRRLWTETEPFDFHGTYVQLTGAFGNPKPIQRPHPPILIGVAGSLAGRQRVIDPGSSSTPPPGRFRCSRNDQRRVARTFP